MSTFILEFLDLISKIFPLDRILLTQEIRSLIYLGLSTYDAQKHLFCCESRIFIICGDVFFFLLLEFIKSFRHSHTPSVSLINNVMFLVWELWVVTRLNNFLSRGLHNLRANWYFPLIFILNKTSPVLSEMSQMLLTLS